MSEGPYYASSQLLANAATAGTYSKVFPIPRGGISFQARGVCDDAGSAVIKIWVSNIPNPNEANDADWDEAGELTLAYTTTPGKDAHHFAPGDAPYEKCRLELDSVSGTAPVINAYVGS